MNSLNKSNLSTWELQVISNREAAPSIIQLDEYQRLSAIKTTLLKITVITGWAVPKAEMMTILVDQFLKLILEGYPSMNVVELEYAFRHYGTKIKDWGKEINLSLITEVLDAYQGSKSEVFESAFKSLPIASEGHIYTDDEYDNMARAEIEAYFQYRRRGIENPLWMPQWVEILIKDGFIKNELQVEPFFDWAIKSLTNLYEKSE